MMINYNIDPDETQTDPRIQGDDDEYVDFEEDEFTEYSWYEEEEEDEEEYEEEEEEKYSDLGTKYVGCTRLLGQGKNVDDDSEDFSQGIPLRASTAPARPLTELEDF